MANVSNLHECDGVQPSNCQAKTLSSTADGDWLISSFTTQALAEKSGILVASFECGNQTTFSTECLPFWLHCLASLVLASQKGVASNGQVQHPQAVVPCSMLLPC